MCYTFSNDAEELYQADLQESMDATMLIKELNGLVGAIQSRLLGSSRN